MMDMVEEVTSFINLPVYTSRGMYVGQVNSVILDVEKTRLDSLLLSNTNPTIVEGSAKVAVPYRWVSAIGDIIILGHFPEKVSRASEEGEE
ncbi:MAG: photosystem reaction center subunit H [Thermoplasmata archaeon HGW-Thermoplasmata-1]|nr:MAG: photosystem reaction center subunit H [Thermoplasmata archaeon HGW-Thermoplasmata-1]